MMRRMPSASDLAAEARAFAAGLPEAWEDHPWGESVYKVGKKVFVFFGVLEADAGLRFTVKLRESHEEAMSMRLGRAGGLRARSRWLGDRRGARTTRRSR